MEKREGLPGCQGRCQHCPLVSQRVEDQVNVRKEELGELFAQMPSLDEEEGGADLSIEKRFLDLLEPLGRRKKQLESSRAKLQISRDLEDETVRGPQPPAPATVAAAALRTAGCRPGQFPAAAVQLCHPLLSQDCCGDSIKCKSKASAF